jgi:hypothetical protein
MIDIGRGVGDSDDQRGTHDPAIRDQPAHQNACEMVSPRFAKKRTVTRCELERVPMHGQ